MRNEFMEAMDFRHACKLFDTDKKISDEDIRYILEAGRKSPSSFGTEPWKFLVITNDALKNEITSVCYDQVQIATSSHLVIILASIEDVKIESGIPEKRLARWGKPQEELDFYMNFYKGHLAEMLKDDEKRYNFASLQTYLASGNMLTAAAFIGVDSCPIGGFDGDAIAKILDIDTSKQQVSLVIPFGYRINAQSKQVRLDFDEVVEFIDAKDNNVPH